MNLMTKFTFSIMQYLAPSYTIGIDKLILINFVLAELTGDLFLPI